MDSFVPESALIRPFYRFYFGQVMPLIGGGLKERKEYRWLYESTESFLSPEALASYFNRIGFTAVKIKKQMFGACVLVQGCKEKI